jgi:hypothetical protein
MLGVARHRRQLVLPEIDEALGELVEVVALGHRPQGIAVRPFAPSVRCIATRRFRIRDGRVPFSAALLL